MLKKSSDQKLTPADRQKHVLDNPHLLDWLFSERTDRFVKYWLKDLLQASWHWYRYEYAVQKLRGSIHCHGVAKLKNDPDYVPSQRKPLRDTWLQNIDMKKKMLSKEQILNIDNEIHEGKEAELIVCSYVDNLESLLS